MKEHNYTGHKSRWGLFTPPSGISCKRSSFSEGMPPPNARLQSTYDELAARAYQRGIEVASAPGQRGLFWDQVLLKHCCNNPPDAPPFPSDAKSWMVFRPFLGKRHFCPALSGGAHAIQINSLYPMFGVNGEQA